MNYPPPKSKILEADFLATKKVKNNQKQRNNMFTEEIKGKEVIDKDGNAIGIVKDLMITRIGRVTHLVLTPAGLIEKIKGKEYLIEFQYVGAIEDVVMLTETNEEIDEEKKELERGKKTKEKSSEQTEREYKCPECEKTFSTEKGLHIHQGEVHK